jgi:hypothetical protein
MKTKASVFLICMLTLTTGLQAAGRTIKGNGKVETRIVNISDYDEIDVRGSMNFEYEQSNAEPFLSIMADENIFEYIEVEVKNAKLSVRIKTGNGFGGGNGINPTVFKVKSNSKSLKKINRAGSGNFTVNSPLQIGSLDINSAGSGNVRLTKNVTGTDLKMNAAGSGNLETSGLVYVEKVKANLSGSGNVRLEEVVSGNVLEISLAGSGNIKAGRVDTETLHCSLASSGNIQVEGKAREADYSVAGSGNIKAFECKAARVKASLSGSGRIEVYASDALSAGTAGSGSIRYKGNPSVKETKTGSGSIRQVQ